MDICSETFWNVFFVFDIMQELIYEEINPRGYECAPDAVKLETLLHCGSFYEVYSGIVQKLEGCKPGTAVVVKKNQSKTISFLIPYNQELTYLTEAVICQLGHTKLISWPLEPTAPVFDF